LNFCIFELLVGQVRKAIAFIMQGNSGKLFDSPKNLDKRDTFQTIAFWNKAEIIVWFLFDVNVESIFTVIQCFQH